MTSTPFGGATAKLTIGSTDDVDLGVVAQYNPKELQIDRAIQWTAPNQANNANGAKKTTPAAKGLHLEFTGVEGRSVTVELLFDAYEAASMPPPKDGGSKPRNIVFDSLWTLQELATVRDPDSTDEDLRRPHLCVVSWGNKGLPSFRCVIESLSIKYSMFGDDGEPLRATATVKLKEVDVLDPKKDKP